MRATDIIAWTINAAILCPVCAEFLYSARSLSVAYDREGNEVRPVFASDEWDYLPCCDCCGEEIEEAYVI